MSPVPRRRFVNYGTAVNYEVWTADKNGMPGTLAKAGAIRSMGSRTDSLLISSGHKAPYSRNIWNGGDFYKTTVETRAQPGSCGIFLRTGPGGGWWSEGLLFATNYSTSAYVLPSFAAIRSVMVPLGAKGWNRYRPGKPVASVAQFIGELRQLPKNPFRLAAATHREMRSLVSRGNTVGAVNVMRRAVGEQYLNYSFGWRPFLADLEKIANFDENLVAAMRQLRRDNGNTIRRNGLIESDTSTTTTTATSGSAMGFMDCPWWSGNTGGSKRDTITTTTWRCWFSAGFVYHLPREDDPNSMSRLRRYLAGGGVSPSVVWELTPWSWLADYFTNIGNVLENWEASRELALAAKYCYVMYNKKVTTTSAHQSWMKHPHYGEWSGAASFVSTTELKARTWASPYGFGFTSGNLSDGQKANLVALGLSRRI